MPKRIKTIRKPKPTLVVINVRLEPSLRKALEAAAQFKRTNPGRMIRRLAIFDITELEPDQIRNPDWVKEEGRSANFNFVALPRLAEAIKVRASDRGLSVTDYIRALSIYQVKEVEGTLKSKGTTILDDNSATFEPRARKGSPKKSVRSRVKKGEVRELEKEEMIAGYTTYKGKKIVDFVEREAAREGLSLSAYQKKLVYQDLEEKYGMKFVMEMFNETQEQWDMRDDFLKRFMRHSAAAEKPIKRIICSEGSEE